MEINSSGEELVLKTRKPYTITKQRERWTEEEHFRFLDAVKRYGRSWQRIEDHIGTKTAVQIRSHAQKFFTKLEKESVARGAPLGQAHDIDIPPPRPKRKPNSPYPRKTGACVSPAAEAVDENASKHVTSQETTREHIGLKINAQTEVSAVTKSVQGIGSCSDGYKCSAVLQETLSTSVSAGHNGSTNPISFKEFVPIANEPKEVYSIGGASLPFERNLQSSINGRNKPDHALGKISKINKDMHALHKSSVLGEMFGVQKHLVKQSENDMQKSDPNRKVQEANGLHSAYTHKSNSEVTAESVEFPSITSPFMNHRISAAPGLQSSLAMSSFPPFVTFPPFSLFRSPQDFYRSFFGISSTFSSLVVSTLLQNPAVHAAACMAASLWPSGEMDPLTESSSMASIVGATVAAAASWWASQGLIPVGPIHDTGLSFPFQPNAIHEANTGQFSKGKKEERDTHQNSSKTYQQDVCHVGLGDLNTQSSPPKSTLSSLSDSEEFENDASNVNNLKPVPGTVAYHSSDNSKLSKKPDRSSCGSNTPSSSEVETDAALKTNGEANDGSQQVPFLNFPMSEEVNTRRARSSGSVNDSWKEVSQEGRVAFQALFARNVLPQTFALQHAKIDPGFSKDLVMGREKVGQSNFLPKETSHGDPKLRRTGFKPYKRCSAEVDANRSSINGETSNKRIRREGEASSFS